MWITSGTPSRATGYALHDLKNTQLGEVAQPHTAADLKDGGHSFSTIHTDSGGTTYLYAGNFWDDRMQRYEKVGRQWVLDDDYEVKTPERTQGVVITDDEMSFSTSYGAEYESEVKTYDRSTLEAGGDGAYGNGLIKSVDLANMAEGMTRTPEGLAVMHESGAKGYIGNDDEWVSPFMSVLSPEQAGITGGGIEVQPESLRDAAKNLATVEDKLASAGRSIHAIHLPAACLGGVEGAADFAKALNLHLDATGIWLKRSEISAGISIEGLRASADEHERTDRLGMEWLANLGRDSLEWQRENGDLIGQGQDLFNDVKDKAGDLKPWDGWAPGL